MKIVHRRWIRSSALFSILLGIVLASASSAGAQADTTLSNRVRPDLEALVREGVQRNPTVVAARDHWEALRRIPIQMRTLPDPQVQLQEFTVGSPKPGAGYESSNFYYTGFGVTQDIPGPGKLRLQGKIAQQDAAVARHQLESAERATAENIREDYFELFYLTQTIGLLERERDDLNQIEEISQARYRVGEGQAQDVLKAQLQATQILNETEHHRREIEQRQADLKAALGREVDSPDITVGKVEATRIELTERDLEPAIKERSTEVQIDRAAAARSEEGLRLARRGYIPDFSVGYAYEKTGVGFPDYYMLTLGAKIPLYFWRKQTPAIEQAALEVSGARARMHAHQLDDVASADHQLVAIHTSDRILKLYSGGLIPQAENSMQAALVAYQVSKADFQTLISAFVDLSNLHQEYYRELADHEIAVAKLEQLLGEVK